MARVQGVMQVMLKFMHQERLLTQQTCHGHQRLPVGVLHVQAIQEDYEVVVCDTSGRLHTNAQLMDELAKCKRAIGKRLAGAPHETLLVLDGTTGHQPYYNHVHQADQHDPYAELHYSIALKLPLSSGQNNLTVQSHSVLGSARWHCCEEHCTKDHSFPLQRKALCFHIRYAYA